MSLAGGEYMYVIGIVSGFALASLFWLVGALVWWFRFNDSLCEERSRAAIKDRSCRTALEDHRGRRRTEGCVEAMDAFDGAAI
jgi:hypothetical protein